MRSLVTIMHHILIWIMKQIPLLNSSFSKANDLENNFFMEKNLRINTNAPLIRCFGSFNDQAASKKRFSVKTLR